MMKFFIFLTTLLLMSSCGSSKDWREASRESTGIAVPASEQEEPIFKIYVARAFSWRGNFATHPWVAWKRAEDEQYTVVHILGWRARRDLSVVVVDQDLPDRKWFDSAPYILDEHKGDKALEIIEHVEKLIEDYPYKMEYGLWPGPNSNTFVQYLIRETEHLKVELPPHAIGKDYLVNRTLLAPSPSQTGVQFSLLGVFGLTLGLNEGVEFNILTMNFGVDFWTPALKLPFVGRVGFKDRAISL